MARDAKPIPVGRLGEVNTDFEAQNLQRFYDPAPPEPPTHVAGKPGVRHTVRPVPPVSTVDIKGVDKMTWGLVGNKPYTWAITRTVPLIVGAAPLRLDTGRGNRIDIVLQNIGDREFWFDFTREATPGVGIFVPGSPVAGAHLGGVWSASLGDSIALWAVADPAGNTTVVVAEFGY